MATAYALYALTATLVTVSLGRVDWVASHAFADARLWLAIRGRTPWRTMAFLADANRRGVLRQTGASYQFRHIRLLEQAREWRSAPRPRLFHEWMRRLSDLEDSTLLRRSRQVRAEELKMIRAEAARCWQIACTRPDTLPSNFGDTLDSLLRRLWPLRDERDLASLRDLLDAYRTLARANADTHTSMSYARALELASRALPPVDAIRAAEEASQIYRPFAEVNPAIGLSALAEAAQRQADLLAEQGRTDEAEGVARDLVDTCRRLTPTSPPAVLPVLAVSLSDLAVRSWESSPDDSIALRSEAANLYRKLAEDDPARFLKHLISSLTAIAISFKTLRQYDAELVAIREELRPA